MNHEVEDDIDVEGTGRKDAEAVGLKEHGVIQRGEGCGDGGVEAFEVADRDDAFELLRKSKELGSFAEGGGEGLLDEHIDASAQKGVCNGGMVEGGHADAGGVERRPCIEESVERREG